MFLYILDNVTITLSEAILSNTKNLWFIKSIGKCPSRHGISQWRNTWDLVENEPYWSGNGLYRNNGLPEAGKMPNRAFGPFSTNSSRQWTSVGYTTARWIIMIPDRCQWRKMIMVNSISSNMIHHEHNDLYVENGRLVFRLDTEGYCYHPIGIELGLEK